MSSLPPKVLKVSRTLRPHRGRGWPPRTREKASTGGEVWPAVRDGGWGRGVAGWPAPKGRVAGNRC